MTAMFAFAIGFLLACSILKRIDTFNTTTNGPNKIKHQSFAAGTIKKCCNLKTQTNSTKLNEIAMKMNNSWVRIMNRSLNDRGQISVESLEYADTFLAVPRRKLQSMIIRCFLTAPKM